MTQVAILPKIGTSLTFGAYFLVVSLVQKMQSMSMYTLWHVPMLCQVVCVCVCVAAFQQLYQLVQAKATDHAAFERDIIRHVVSSSYDIWCKQNWYS